MIVSKRKINTVLKYIVLIAVGIVMVYPLLWMISSVFKNNSEIFTNIGLIPEAITFDGCINALKDFSGDINLLKSMINTYSYVVPKVIFTVISTALTAYGFGRFKFRGRNVLFAVMLSSLFLPQTVLNVPQFTLFTKLGWVNSKLYLPIILPALFAVDTYFVFMIMQFMRSIPRELDEAAEIDGCNSFQRLVLIIAPMLKPALVSCALFQFMWSSNDFMGPLLYVNTPKKYPAALFVKLSLDADSGFDWNRVLAVSLISIIPLLIVFFLAQKHFVDGISTGSIK